jgi:hypothetical protein
MDLIALRLEQVCGIRSRSTKQQERADSRLIASDRIGRRPGDRRGGQSGTNTEEKQEVTAGWLPIKTGSEQSCTKANTQRPLQNPSVPFKFKQRLGSERPSADGRHLGSHLRLACRGSHHPTRERTLGHDFRKGEPPPPHPVPPSPPPVYNLSSLALTRDLFTSWPPLDSLPDFKMHRQAWAKLHLSYEATANGVVEDAHNYV